MQKIIIGLLAVAIVGTVGYGIVTAIPQADTPTEEALVENEAVEATPEPTEAVEVEVIEATEAPAEVVAPTAETIIEANPTVAPAETMVFDMDMGEEWEAFGTVTAIETAGIMMMVDAETEVFVELGPPNFWQEQGVAIAVGDTVMVTGFDNGEQIHAKTVTTDTAQLMVRAENGQPLWSGGSDNADGTHEEPMVAAEDWVTIEATVVRTTNGGLDIMTDDGEAMSLQLGRPDFWQEQEVVLNANDDISVLGFWDNDTFMAGEIRVVETGERIFLRDPNGRPLWGGPGNSGGNGGEGNQGDNGQGGGNQGDNGQGNGNQGEGNQGVNGNGGQSQHTDTADNGQGNGNNGTQTRYRGGRGDATATPTQESF